RKPIVGTKLDLALAAGVLHACYEYAFAPLMSWAGPRNRRCSGAATNGRAELVPCDKPSVPHARLATDTPLCQRVLQQVLRQLGPVRRPRKSQEHLGARSHGEKRHGIGAV